MATIRPVPGSFRLLKEYETGPQWPAMLPIGAGLHRCFFISFHIGLPTTPGTALALATDPTIKGQAHFDYDSFIGSEHVRHIWFWLEDELEAAPVPTSGGTALFVPPTFTGTFGNVSMMYGTLENVNHPQTPPDYGINYSNPTNLPQTVLDVPDSSLGQSALPYAGRDELNLIEVAFESSRSLVSIELAEELIAPTEVDVDTGIEPYKLGLYSHVSQSQDFYDLTFDADVQVWAQFPLTQWTVEFNSASVVRNQTLASKRPSMRQIDARTLADRYNAGQPLKPDYTWPGGRKFYQDPPPSA